MPYTSLNETQFNQQISLRDAYRVMYKFASDYLDRGDTPISDFLFCYAGEVISGETTDPAALDDYVKAVHHVINQQVPSL